MFKKIVSNLPFQPTLLDQVSFYYRRLNKETSIRKLGFIMICLVLVLQLFTIIFPTEPSLATSTNDLIYGASSKDQVIQAYTINQDSYGRKDIRAIYDHYGIGLEQIQTAMPQKIGSKQKKFISTGRGTSPGIDKFVPIANVNDGGIYERPLSNWDVVNSENWYNTITGMSRFGFRFWIIIDGCGNIVFEHNTLQPTISIIKHRLSSGIINVGEDVTYKIQFQNSGPGQAEQVRIDDILPAGLTYRNYTSDSDLKFNRNGQKLSWQIDNAGSTLPASQRWYTITLNLTASTPSVKPICNTAEITSSSLTIVGSSITENDSCVTVSAPTCPGTGLTIPDGGIENCQITCPDGSVIPYNKTCSIPQLSCASLKIYEATSWDRRKFETKIISQSGGIANSISYYINNVKAVTIDFTPGSNSQIFTNKFPGPGKFRIKAVLNAKVGDVQPSQNCEATVIITKPATPLPRISTDKTVSNITQHIANANNTIAQPGDKLRYTIFILNSGDAPATNLKLDGDFGESINDILEYAKLIDKGDAKLNKQTNFLSWGAVTIPAHGIIQKSFIVQVKDPVPATPISASDPLSYDFNMQNEYGRLVVIRLNKPITKIVEQTVKTIPNTGSGVSLTLTFVISLLVGYFYYRNKLLVKELSIIQFNYSSGGM